jgi:hypothetical protein
LHADAILYAVFADMSIVGMNLSLMMNTVGFYQVSSSSDVVAFGELQQYTDSILIVY